jgi:hypothetical protein
VVVWTGAVAAEPVVLELGLYLLLLLHYMLFQWVGAAQVAHQGLTQVAQMDQIVYLAV